MPPIISWSLPDYLECSMHCIVYCIALHTVLKYLTYQYAILHIPECIIQTEHVLKYVLDICTKIIFCAYQRVLCILYSNTFQIVSYKYYTFTNREILDTSISSTPRFVVGTACSIHYVHSNMLSLLYKAVLRAGRFCGWA